MKSVFHILRVMVFDESVLKPILLCHIGKGWNRIVIVQGAELQERLVPMLLHHKLHREPCNDMIPPHGKWQGLVVSRHGRQQIDLPRLQFLTAFPPVHAGYILEFPSAILGKEFHVFIAVAAQMSRAVFLQKARSRHISHTQCLQRCGLRLQTTKHGRYQHADHANSAQTVPHPKPLRKNHFIGLTPHPPSSLIIPHRNKKCTKIGNCPIFVHSVIICVQCLIP